MCKMPPRSEFDEMTEQQRWSWLYDVMGDVTRAVVEPRKRMWRVVAIILPIAGTALGFAGNTAIDHMKEQGVKNDRTERYIALDSLSDLHVAEQLKAIAKAVGAEIIIDEEVVK